MGLVVEHPDPEARGDDPDQAPQDRTDAGRRADELIPEGKPASSRALLKRTLHYQRLRRPKGGSLLLAATIDDPLGDTTRTASVHPSSRGPRRILPIALIAITAALAAGGGVALLLSRRPATPTKPTAALTHDASRRSNRHTAEPSDASPPRDLRRRPDLIEPLITHRLRFDEFEKGIEAMQDGSACKVVLDWTDARV